MLFDQAGSSPRVRGKRALESRSRLGGRLIPACAGKTSSATRATPPRPAHPRVCGENFCQGMRSPPSRAHPRVCGENSTGNAYIIKSTAAHPRVCGENHSPAILSSVCDGSSPRVRGKLLEGLRISRFRGLIPACAGKTGPHSERILRTKAHPRVCGENSVSGTSRVLSPGSSPRVRGKLRITDLPRWMTGLIPACAGKTSPSPPRKNQGPAHPRVCGENGCRLVV